MSKRKRHTPKYPKEQEYYLRTFKSFESEPTSDEGFEFPQSDDLEEQDVLPISVKRPRSNIETVQRHFKYNRNNWIISLAITASVAIVILFLTNIIDIKEQMARFEGLLQGISDKLIRHEQDISDIREEAEEQQYKLNEQSIKLEYLEKDLQKSPEVK